MITVRAGQLIRFKDKKKFPNADVYLVLERCPLPEKYCWPAYELGTLKIQMYWFQICWKVLGPNSNIEYVQDSFLKDMEVVKS